MADTEATELQTSSKKKYLLMLIIVVLQAVLSYFLILFFFKPHAAKPVNNKSMVKKTEESAPKELTQPQQQKLETSEEEEQNSQEHADDAVIGEVFLIEDLVINPAGTRGRRFVSLSIGLELNRGQKIEDLKIRKPKICDAIITLLAKKSFWEFADIHNRKNIRRQIFETVKKTTPKGMIRQIYITKFILQ